MTQQKIHELDVVALTVGLPELKLVRGQVGTVVHVNAPDAFDVEFVDDTGHTYGLASLTSGRLLRLDYKPIGA